MRRVLVHKNLVRIIFLGLLFGAFFYYQAHPVSAYSFNSPQLLDSKPSFDQTPAAFQASDGTLWVAWDGQFNITNEIFGMNYNTGVWSPQFNLTSGPLNQVNTYPALGQLANGTIILVWSSSPTGNTYNLNYKLYNNGVWSKPVQLTAPCAPGGCSLGDGDFSARIVLGKDSSLWVFWSRQVTVPVPTCVNPLSPVCRQVFYKILSNGSWSGEVQLTSDLTWNRHPGAAVMMNGNVWVSYQKWISKSSNYNIFMRTFNGTVWSSEVQMTSVNTWDQHPNLVQDRNGTIWMLWMRNISLGTTFQDKLFYQFSPDGGLTWSAATQLTFGGTSLQPIDDEGPVPVQGMTRNLDGTPDHAMWIFYDSNAFLNGTDFAMYYIKTNQIFPVHNAAVTKISVTPSIMFPWGIRAQNISTATITVTISNLGDFPENITYSVQAVNTTIFNVGSGHVLLSGSLSKTFSFAWNASLASPGLYTIVGSVVPVFGETIGARMDDTLRFKWLAITYPGDLNLSGRISIFDASIFGAAWQTVPGMPNYNPDADINNSDHRVDIVDASIFGANWQKAICNCPP